MWYTYTGKFGEMARICFDKYLVNLKFANSHNQDRIEMCAVYTYAYSHCSLVADRSQMETYEVDSCVCGHRVFRGVCNPTIGESVQCHLWS